MYIYLKKLCVAVTNIFISKVKKNMYTLLIQIQKYTLTSENIILFIRSKMDNFTNLSHFHSK